jgi:hypothetical protein
VDRAAATELRIAAGSRAIRRTARRLAALALLGALANCAYLPADASAHEAANSFTSVNAAVLLALLVGVIGSTGAELAQSLGPRTTGPPARAVLGAKARAYALIGIAAALAFAALAAAVALPVLDGRGLPGPPAGMVFDYISREAVAAARLAVIGVAIGIVVGRRSLALAAVVVLLAVEGVAETYVPFVRNYGPIGALNAFSDPTHHHQLPVAMGGLIASGWALAALVGASLVLDLRRGRAPGHAATIPDT